MTQPKRKENFKINKKIPYKTHKWCFLDYKFFPE